MTQPAVPATPVVPGRVQALLSTAAARQEAEQREVRALVGQLLDAVRALPAELREVREELARVAAAQEAMRGAVQTEVMRSQGSLNGLVATQLAAMESRLVERLDGTLVAVVEAMLRRQDPVAVPAQPVADAAPAAYQA